MSNVSYIHGELTAASSISLALPVVSRFLHRSEVGMGQTIYQSMQQKGYSRRDFLQFCAVAATAAGLSQSGASQVVSAFEKKDKPAVIWLHFQECTCCSESFIRASHPIVLDVLLNVLDLNYSETLMPGLRLSGGKRASTTPSRTTRENTLCWWKARCPLAMTASIA